MQPKIKTTSHKIKGNQSKTLTPKHIGILAASSGQSIHQLPQPKASSLYKGAKPLNGYHTYHN